MIDTAFYVVPKIECNSLHFLYHALRQQDLSSLGADSAVPGLNRNLVYMSNQLLPPVPLLNKFEMITAPIFALLHLHLEESRTLACIRDTLLPKLISGALRVKDAERFAEKVLRCQ